MPASACRMGSSRPQHFIDNTAVLGAFTKGASSQPDIALLAHILHLHLAKWKIRVHFEYVPSEPNLSDLVSREDFSIMDKLGAVRVAMPPVPPRSELDGPLQRWVEHEYSEGLFPYSHPDEDLVRMSLNIQELLRRDAP